MNPEEILTSLQNPRIKALVRLRDRRDRDRERQFVIEGFREISRAVEAKLPLAEVFTCPELYLGSQEHELLGNAASKCGAQICHVSREVFQKISYRDRPDGLIARAPKPEWGLNRWDKLITTSESGQAPLFIVAQSIEKPGNLGTLLRTSDAAAVSGLIVVDRCTDLFNPNVVRASVGTLFTVPVAECSSEEALQWFRENNIRLVATSPDAPSAYTDTDLSGPIAIVMGSEQYGLDDRWLAETDLQVSIPMAGSADSLNVAMATAVVLFESLRQRSLR
ncbi:rRNA methyltransferase [bacterium TMED181]|nr:rRNA methyltransferase [Planctomycetota bacterium]OUW44076.1 MAG: rRNA methyltransferase [bacterium TMED181]